MIAVVVVWITAPSAKRGNQNRDAEVVEDKAVQADVALGVAFDDETPKQRPAHGRQGAAGRQKPDLVHALTFPEPR